MRLPVGLLHDPAGWLRHAGALGGQPARLVALLDALKPLLGLSGQPGELVFTPGVTLSGHDAGGRAGAACCRRHGAVRRAARHAARPAGGRVSQASVRIPGSGDPTLALDLHLGVDGAGPGRKAAHVSLDGGLQVFLRPETGADIVLFPAGPGLAAAAAAGAIDAANHALPFLLDKLAAQTGPSLAGIVGTLVAEVGDLLSLRDGTPQFTYDRLVAFAADPVAALEAAATARLAGALPALRQALDDALPASIDVQAIGQTLQVTAGPVVLRWQPNPFRLEVTADATGLPAVDHVTATLALTASGLDDLSVVIGPAPVPAGPVELRPVLAVFAGAAPAGGRRVELGLDLDGTRRFAAQWLLDASTVQLVVLDGTSPPVTDPAAVAERAGRDRRHAGGLDRAGGGRGATPARPDRRHEERRTAAARRGAPRRRLARSRGVRTGRTCSCASCACSTTWPVPTSPWRSTAASRSASARTAAASSASRSASVSACSSRRAT